MGCGEACALVPARKRLDWQIPDPAHQPLEVYRHVRDVIEGSVKVLVEQLCDEHGRG
jgi:protein-tyrosine-phosphatase